MGACNTSEGQQFRHQIKPLADLREHYSVITNHNDIEFGEYSKIQVKGDDSKFICKHFYPKTAEQFDRSASWLTQLQTTHSHVNILQPREIFGTERAGIIFKNSEIAVLLDLPETNLLDEIKIRMDAKTAFTREEVASVLIGAIKGYSALEKAGRYADKVRLRHIFFPSKELSTAKIVDSALLAQPTNIGSLIERGHQDRVNCDIYLAPQQMPYLKSSSSLPEAQLQKAGVFSLAVAIMDMCLLKSNKNNVYNYEAGTINLNELNSRLQVVNKQYGRIIGSALKSMLHQYPNQRPSFIQLDANIPSVMSYRLENSFSNASGTLSKSLFLASESTVRRVSTDLSMLQDGDLKSLESKSKNFFEEPIINVENVVENFSDGSVYSGQKSKGLRNGRGKFIYKDKSSYDGNWVNNRMAGKGDLLYPDRSIEYTGEWYNDMFDGWGQYNRSPAQGGLWRCYQGEFIQGFKHGRGKLIFRDGSVYEGQFRLDRLHGLGTRYNPIGVQKQRQFHHWEGIDPDYIDLS